MRRLLVLSVCVVAAASLGSAQRTKAPGTLEAFLRGAPVVLNTQRNTVRVIDWIKAPAGTLRAAAIEVSQCLEGLDSAETPLQLQQRYVLFLDRWTAAGAFSTTDGARAPLAGGIQGAPGYRDDVIRHLTTSTCACGTSAGVQRELSSFVAEFPSAPERAAVESRLAAVRADRAGIRANCKSG